ncbi:MAG: hypothetical protein II744_01830 [Eubacterium sp.]|nr:hypothetical protein [Eubacterium sp.]
MSKISKKRRAQICVDVLMTLDLLILMSYRIAGEFIHEILGVIMFVLVALHIVLTFNYTKALLKSGFSVDRLIRGITDYLLLIIYLLMILSASTLSKHLLSFLDLSYYSGVSRIIHLICSYWGFALISMHIGMHFDYVFAKPMKNKKVKPVIITVMSVLSVAGLYMFIHEEIYKYMLLINPFVYFDTEGGLLLFLSKYVLIMIMYVSIGYGLIKLAKIKKKK